jgi:hypothetical protein
MALSRKPPTTHIKRTPNRAENALFSHINACKAEKTTYHLSKIPALFGQKEVFESRLHLL